MCIWDLAVFQCGHFGGFSRRDGGCALPKPACDKERVNAIRCHLPYDCLDCAHRWSQGIPLHPEDDIHPVFRSVQQPMLPVVLPPAQGVAVSRHATVRKMPSPKDMVEEDGYDFSEFAEYAKYPTLPQKRPWQTSPTKIIKRHRISRSKYSSDTPQMFGRLGNIAEDLSEIAMPAARARKGGEGYSPPKDVRLHGTVQDVSELDHLPPGLIAGFANNTSPTGRRQRNERSPVLLNNAGVAKRRISPTNSYAPRRISPTQRISPTHPRALYATADPASAATGSTYTAYNGYAAASQAATRQKQTATRTYQETYDDVSDMIQSRRYSPEEIMASNKFAQLSIRDQDEVFWQYEREQQAQQNGLKGLGITMERRKTHNLPVRSREEDGRTKKNGCVVM
ncbi:uncharacterized protein Z520_03537 [Fonsecaea multimorphosa CBS 102226]|uniref:Uncharacterized protein n=1 Tax=Fonsecaea multimorphosa CBS 102226 TaxID=1442371 RepID=A0A0D2HG70_9EURO|nr:uncharacterized protein Z520_03537 [Fonsecaea multimorphosa CBS 102226]KIY00871.1 hypothetical protein Z520_03537 [Fonsecaea multimorphosa CBS 102226]OAL27698.1 hypothetical protein AYO22_03364 [Fonsecaea multimorphosa]